MLNLKDKNSWPTPKDEDWKYTNLAPLCAVPISDRPVEKVASSITLEKQNNTLILNVKKQPKDAVYLRHDGGEGDYLPTGLDIRVAAGLEVTLVETFEGQGCYFRPVTNRITLEPGAVLRHYRLQKESAQAFHVADIEVSVPENARYESFTLTCGGRLSRHEVSAEMNGEGAHATFGGVMLQTGEQHADTTLRLNHNSPGATSNQLYKTVLDGKASAVFQGRVIVARDAQKTEAHQLSKGLLLSDQALMNIKPELKIYADDVQCSHGATVGQLDDAALFYLRSRGIDEGAAQGLLMKAFIAEAFATVADDAIRNEWEEEAEKWFNSL